MSLSRLSSFVVLAFVAAPVAGAQASTTAPSLGAAFHSPATVTVDGKPIGAAEPWGETPVGKYKVAIATPDGVLAGEIDLSEKDGKLAAQMMTADNGQFHALEATVKGTDLVLNLNRPKAPITLTLQKHGQRLSGTWSIDANTGTLEGELQ